MTNSRQNSSQPLVSVVMSFHSGKQLLLRAVHSIVWQTYTNWELILISDGSSAGIEWIAENFQDARICCVSNSERRGLPSCLNQGVALAKGVYIARMDADDMAFPERFAKQVAYLQTHPDVDLLATAALLIDGEDQAIGVLPVGLSHAEITRRIWQGFAMPHPTWMGRADWFRANPYEALALKGQDQGLLLRTFLHSRFAGISDVLLGYRYDGLSLQKTVFARYHFLRMLWRNAGKLQWLRGLVRNVLAAARDALAILLKQDGVVIHKRVRPMDAVLIAQWQTIQLRMSQLLR